MIKQLFVGSAVAGIAITLAPSAHASETIDVHEICSHFGNQPYLKYNGMVCATGPSVLVPGNPIANAVRVRWPDAFPADAANPWSDWVLPGGRASALPPQLGVITPDMCDPDPRYAQFCSANR